ncbi:LANO_0C04390g1_1 [Lachancea nothofagi CBS 11611]|uniref:LANO_0C04390g1_1 n=1 Tax=Lachancea nothofagi CBS 11611 TaxID=1266666 RepID=A0A1G4J6W9_9SACH|nr:LANO_0C04390g1_1 [Lachancea nothofagi CBS 11611]
MENTEEDYRQKLIPQLKGKLWYCLEQQVKKELPNGVNYSPKFINALVELSFTQLVDIGCDLEAFAKHAGRETIVPEDLMLMLRKSQDLQTLLRQKLERDAPEARTNKR